MKEPLVRRIAVTLVVVMGLVSLVPRVEASFIPSDQSVQSSSLISRQENMATIQKVLEQKLIKERLKDLGYADDEIKARIDQLSDTELHSLATQLDALVPAGDGFEAAVIILLVLVLVVLVLLVMGKRIHVS
jgi:predicted PurR-regulated permease PerM